MLTTYVVLRLLVMPCVLEGFILDSTPLSRQSDCGPLTPPVNGDITYVNGTNITMSGAKITFTCDDGYYLVGGNQSSCQADGQWSIMVPQCNRACRFLNVAHGTVTPNNITTVGTRVSISCDDGYVLVGSHRNLCRTGGQWVLPAPVCKRECGPLTPLDHGSTIYLNGSFSTYHGTFATFSCDEGYHLVGGNILKCQADGNWSLTSSECRKRDCGRPSLVGNAIVEYNETTYLSRANYSCVRGFDLFGYTSVVCSGNGNWTQYPSCLPNTCRLLNVAHGTVTPSNVTTVGTRVSISCDDGYVLIGLPRNMCRTGGRWVVPAPICGRDCGRSVSLNNGIVTYPNKTTFGSMITFTCHDGYILEGSSTSYCDSTGTWNNTGAICRIKACAPQDLGNGKVTPNNDTSIGVRVTYSCDKGYKLFGFSGNRCMPDGNWAVPLPFCSVDCGSLDHLAHENMFFIYGDGITTLGAVVTFSCDEGYQLVGDNTSECQADGHWSARVPVCKIYDCGPLHPLANGIVSYVNRTNITTFGQAIKFSCEEGYYLVGSNISKCQADGRWSIQVPECRITDCGRNITLANGDVIYPNGSSYGSMLMYTCDAGYTLVGSNTTYCALTGTWKSITTVCKIKDCGRNLSLNNGNVTYANVTTFGSMLTYTCHDGYTVEGSNTSYCDSSGTWNNTGTICTVKACRPLHPAHGSVTPDNNTSIGVQVKYSCEKGYTLFGFSGNRCKPDGNWAVPLPVCQVDCGRLDHLAHENMSYIYGNGITTLGAVVTFSCDEGYQLIGDNTSECQANGHWSAPVPDCKIINCEHLNHLGNGSISYVGGLNTTRFGAIVTFSCEEGYILVGDNHSTCQADGRWSAPVPECETTCKLVDFAHGHVMPSGNVTAGRIVEYSCDDGYTLIGFVRNQCKPDGHWAVPVPECKRGCRYLNHPSNGKISYIYGEGITTFGAVVTFNCDEGYQLIGGTMSVCQTDGHWSVPVPECRMKD